MKSDHFRSRMLAATRENRQDEGALKRRIAKLYEDAAEDMASKAAASRSGSLTERFARDLTADLKARAGQLWRAVGDTTRGGMQTAAGRAVGAQTGLLSQLGQGLGQPLDLAVQARFGTVADRAVAHVLRGGVYGGQAPTLSKRIWNNAALQSGQIEQVIAQAVAKGESPIQLAKALQAFVNPNEAEPSNWNDVYDIPFDYGVDYNAKRLAVTSMRHAAWGAMIAAARDNPFADFIHWELTPSHVIFDICDAHAIHEEGLGEGNFSLDSVPLTHPWCTCLLYADTNKSFEQMGEELAQWVNGERDDERLDRAFGAWEHALGFREKSGEAVLLDNASRTSRIRSTPRDFLKQSDKSLQKGIAALEKKIEEHNLKIQQLEDELASMAHPTELDVKKRQGLLHHWKKETANFHHQKDFAKAELKRREQKPSVEN